MTVSSMHLVLLEPEGLTTGITVLRFMTAHI